MFLSCPFVCLLVCQQDYTKTTDQISMKLGWMMGLGPEWTPSTSGADPHKVMEPGSLFLSLKIARLG